MTWCNVTYIIRNENFPDISSLINFTKDVNLCEVQRNYIYIYIYIYIYTMYVCVCVCVCVCVPISFLVDDSDGGFIVRRRQRIVHCNHIELSVFLSQWDTYHWWNMTVGLCESRVTKVRK
jgi:hypothetical protein